MQRKLTPKCMCHHQRCQILRLGSFEVKCIKCVSVLHFFFFVIFNSCSFGHVSFACLLLFIARSECNCTFYFLWKRYSNLVTAKALGFLGGSNIGLVGCGQRIEMEAGCRTTEILMEGCGIKNTAVGVGFAQFDWRDAG